MRVSLQGKRNGDHFLIAPGKIPPAVFLLVSEGKNNGGSKRYSRKREPSFPKTDTFPGPRRTSSQKGKNFDKRPSQRGGRQYGVTGGGRREEVSVKTDSKMTSFKWNSN